MENILFLAIFAVHFLLELDACSCSLDHLQTHFCQAGFAVKARVISPEVVIYDSFDGQSTPVSRKYEIEVKEIFKGDSTILGTTTESETQSFHGGQQKTKPRRNRNRKWRRNASQKVANLHVTQSYDELPDEISLPDETPTGFDLTATRPDDIEKVTDDMEIDATFPYTTQQPTTSAQNASTQLWLYTSLHDASCGVRLESKVGYLILGWISQGRLWTGLCRHTMPWASLSHRQKRALGLDLYGKSCSCQIETCYHRSCMSHRSRGSCMWSPYEDEQGCYDRNSNCRQIESRCEWRHNKDLRKCLHH